MCAIIGWNGTMPTPLLRDLYRNASKFGPHAVGLAYVEKDAKIKLFKRACHPRIFLRNCNHRIERAAKFSLGYGHVRLGTTGCNNNTDHAHPFIYDGEDSRYIYAHNGKIKNWKVFRTIEAVDSEIMGPFIEQNDTTPLIGTIGLIWMEQSLNGTKMFIYRHNKTLSASLITFVDESQCVVVHTFSRLLTDSKLMASVLRIVPLYTKEGTAYEVTKNGLVPAWTDFRAPVINMERMLRF
jgi:predicted glutamine amidotransferase